MLNPAYLITCMCVPVNQSELVIRSMIKTLTVKKRVIKQTVSYCCRLTVLYGKYWCALAIWLGKHCQTRNHQTPLKQNLTEHTGSQCTLIEMRLKGITNQRI